MIPAVLRGAHERNVTTECALSMTKAYTYLGTLGISDRLMLDIDVIVSESILYEVV